MTRLSPTTRWATRLLVAVAVLTLSVAGCSRRSEQRATIPPLVHVNLRLQWYPQAQFAGYVVAKELGYYRDEGLDVDVRPAGPDLKPLTTIANGSDDIAVGVSNQVIEARANRVPVKIIAQLFQDSANLYVLKKSHAIRDLRDLRGKRVGLWLGGDEAEFTAMLSSRGMKMSDVHVVPQGESVAPFLHDQYVLSQVTAYNELLQIEDAGLKVSDLQILRPANYNAAIPGDMLFTTERYLSSRRDIVVRFLRASLKGWEYVKANPDSTVAILKRLNPDLNERQQKRQLAVVVSLVWNGQALKQGIGLMDSSAYIRAIRVLVGSGQIKAPPEAPSIFDDAPWREALLSK